MYSRTTKEDIQEFLVHMQRLMIEGRYDFVPRRKNMLSLAKHGLTIADAKEEILGLTIDEYYKGPKCDLDPKRPGDVWEFKKKVGRTAFYVKVKIVVENGLEVLKCLGFHEDDFA